MPAPSSAFEVPLEIRKYFLLLIHSIRSDDKMQTTPEPRQSR
jgi:hypothetical protein